LARRAADEAVRADATSAEAMTALGMALVAADENGNNKRAAGEAFAKAVFMDKLDATNHYYYGFGLRFYASQQKVPATRNAEVQRAVPSLEEAIRLRPQYFAAHRELAYCYHLLGKRAEAMKSYEMAVACRGTATDADDLAGADVALAALHQEEANNSTGEKKKAHEEAAQGHTAEARENSSDNLKTALSALGAVGLGSNLLSINSYLPAEAQQALSVINNPAGALKDKIREKIPFGGFGLPF
ncbi:MAG TPA: hypothetical protein VF719_11795, partial [Abditibacteriaceae bacterium]